MTAALFDASPAVRRTARAAALAGVLAAVAGVALLAVSGWFLTGAALAGAGGIAAVQAFNYLLPSAGIRALAITRTAGRYGERLLGHRATLQLMAEVRPRLFARLAAAPPQAVQAFGGGLLATRLGQDVDALEDLSIRRIARVSATAAALAGLAATLLAGPASAAVLALGLAASLALPARLAPRLLGGPWARHGKALADLSTAHVEYARVGGELAIYGQTARVASLLQALGAEVDAARLAITTREAALAALHLALATLTIAALLALSTAPAPLQALAALAAAAAFDALGSMVASLLQRQRSGQAIARLAAIFALPRRVAAPVDTALAGLPLRLAMAGPAICVEPGGRVQLTGASGSGKTRLAETLLGLRADAPQQLHIGQTEARQLGLDQLRALFAIAGQDAVMIAGSVADNLRLARPGVDEAAMRQALAIAQLAEVVEALPDGLETWLGDSGARLSGGERKRLGLARALLAGRPWLILDEVGEGLDGPCEQRLAAALDGWARATGTGLIIISHRPALAALAPLKWLVSSPS